MRRTTTVLLTSLLLSSGATLATPGAAQAATGCSASSVSNFGYGTCSGIDPHQTWQVQVECVRYVDSQPFFGWATSGWMTGDGSTTTSYCGWNSNGTPASALYPTVVFGPMSTTGPTGQITGYVGKCVDVNGARSDNGTPVQIYDCNGTNAQQWTVGADGTLRALGKCMDVQLGGTANHTLVQLFDCNGSGAQQWKPQPNGSLLNPQSGRCLDDLGFSTTNGNQLGIWDCNSAANQKWNLPS